MPKRRNARRQPAPSDDERMTVILCRGGDCGSRAKHPEVDHSAQLAQFRSQLDPRNVSVVASNCLDACEHSNVIVIVPDRDGRRLGATPVWIGSVNTTDTTTEIIDWVSAGGPARAPEPTLVSINAFRPTRLSRHELESRQALP